MKEIDFRSDTITKPSLEMRDVMVSADVGDDVFGEDPTVNALQSFAANMFGMDAALYCSSGTQTNQIAINVHVQPGGEVICHEASHIYKYEGGGIAKNSGASVRLLSGNRGRITAEQVEMWINPATDVHFPLTQLVSIEDTSNRGGGAIYDYNEIMRIAEVCRKHHLPFHLDGARLFNSLIETGIDVKEYASNFDSISICLSKGLGAPVGSLLLGNHEFIQKARRVRKVFGGGMRQAGIIAAAGLFALENNIERLKDDHFHAKELEKVLKKFSWVDYIMEVETNIIVIVMRDPSLRDQIIAKLKEKHILTVPFGPGMIRMVTHMDISERDIHYTIDKLKELKL